MQWLLILALWGIIAIQIEILRREVRGLLIDRSQGETSFMKNLGELVDQLKADVAAETTVKQSVITLINGIPKMISDAVAAAQAAGATPEQLQSLTDLAASIEQNSAEMQAAVVANTPAQPPAGGQA